MVSDENKAMINTTAAARHIAGLRPTVECVCPVCGSTFQSGSASGIYCSPACKYTARRKRELPKRVSKTR